MVRVVVEERVEQVGVRIQTVATLTTPNITQTVVAAGEVVAAGAEVLEAVLSL